MFKPFYYNESLSVWLRGKPVSYTHLLLFAAMLLPAKKVLLVSLCAWGGFDMAIDEMGFGYKMYLYSPLSYTRLNIIDAHHTNLYYPCLLYTS